MVKVGNNKATLHTYKFMVNEDLTPKQARIYLIECLKRDFGETLIFNNNDVGKVFEFFARHAKYSTLVA